MKAAREFAEQYIDQSHGTLTLSHEVLGFFFWLGGQPKEVAQLVSKSLPEHPVRSELRRTDAGRRRDRRHGDT